MADVPLPDDPLRLFVPPWQLRRDIALLRRWRYEFVTFGELAARAARGDAAGCVALTFDDGFADNLTAAAPLLLEAKVPATFFIVTGWLDGRHPGATGADVLSGDGVRELLRLGFEIGAHTVSHPDLTTLSSAEVCAEVGECRTQLESLLRNSVRVAAYPYGAADARVRDACRDVGIEAACRVGDRGTWLDPLDLPRPGVGNRTSVLGLRLKRDGRYDQVLCIPAMRRLRNVRRRVRWALSS